MTEKHKDDESDSEFSDSNDKRAFSLSEMMRELTTTGLATFFMTEESVRSYLKDKKFPKELAGLLIDGVSKKKHDLYAMLAIEFGRVLSKIDLSQEVGRFLEKHKIHFEAKISFEPKNERETKISIHHEKGNHESR